MKETTLCDLPAKAYKASPEQIKELVREAEYICKKCFRSAKKKKHLCKPEKL